MTITLTAYDRSPALAELKISYRRRAPRVGTQAPPAGQLTDVTTATTYLRSVWNLDTIELIEDFLLVCLDTKHVPLGWIRVATGSCDRAVVDPRIIFGVALQVGSAAIIVAHNHPSGDVSPSPEDRGVTTRLSEAGKLLSIPLLDHIILSKTTSFSFAESGDL